MPKKRKNGFVPKELTSLLAEGGSAGRRTASVGDNYSPQNSSTYDAYQGNGQSCSPSPTVVLNMENIEEPFQHSDEKSHTDSTSSGTVDVGAIDNLSSSNDDNFSETTDGSIYSGKAEDVKMPFHAMSNTSTKLVSFPHLKERVESDFVCKRCLTEGNIKGKKAILANNITLKQSTYGLVTVLTFTCTNNHVTQVMPECVDDSLHKHTTKNFVLNYKYILAMQLLGKGLRSMSTFTALMGIRVNPGNYKTWRWIQDLIGKCEDKLARECCHEN